MPSPLQRTLLFMSILLLSALTAPPARAQSFDGASWIWGSWATELTRPAGEKCYFRCEFDLSAEPETAVLAASCDNRFTCYINGEVALSGDDWSKPRRANVKKLLKRSKNVLAFEGINDSAPAGLLFSLDVALSGGVRWRKVSDASILTHASPGDPWYAPSIEGIDGWKPARVLGLHGVAPWGMLAFTRPPHFEPLPGFVVEPVADQFGSVLSMAFDPEGNSYYGVEGGGLYCIAKDTKAPYLLTSGVSSSQGLCFRPDSPGSPDGHLYASGNDATGAGVFRMRIEKKGGVPSAGPIERLGGFTGSGGEHGVHGIVNGPGGRLYISVGNHHQIAQPWSPDSPYRIHYEGMLLPNMEDPLGHAVGIRSPGGTIVSIDPEGKDWRVEAGGFRNAYDLAFDLDGEMFTYDSDMEWDVGLPWYRPVRMVHVIPGGEYGWRSGEGCWPDYFFDSLPPAVETGRGSPTGMALCRSRMFPEKYYGSILACDWSQGTLLAFHMKRNAAGMFEGNYEILLRGHPLNVTDVEQAADGSVWFTLGGRGSYGGVFRLAYAPAENPLPAAQVKPGSAFAERKVVEDPVALLQRTGQELCRFQQFELGLAIERRSPSAFHDLPNLRPELAPVLYTFVARWALQHATDPAARGEIEYFSKQLIEYLEAHRDRADGFLAGLRALELFLLNPLAGPGGPVPAEIQTKVPGWYPHADRRVNRELAALISHFDSAAGCDKLIQQLQREPSRLEQIHIASCLRAMSQGWSDTNRRAFIEWFRLAQTWPGGASFQGYIAHMLSDFLPRLNDAEKQLVGTPRHDAAKAATAPAPAVAETGASFVKDLDFTSEFVDRVRTAPRRSAAEGALLYKSLCARCHVCGNQQSGQVGPDLTSVVSRFGTSDLLDAIIHPSRVISDQYPAWDVTRRAGSPVTGLKVRDDSAGVAIVQADGTRVDVARADIVDITKSAVSLMPEGMLDPLTYEQVADLVAFLDGRGAAQPAESSRWKAIFNGHDLKGWTYDSNLWKVEDGVAVGFAQGLPESRFLAYDTPYSNFCVEFDVLLRDGNSGMQFRSARPPKNLNLSHALLGYQADVGQSYWGMLYEEGGRGILAQPANEIWSSILRKNEYNHYVVTADGDHIQIEFNGVVTVDLHDNFAREGLFGFQLHAGIRTDVRYRNIRVMKL
jgi:putative heme-binding domain-containing protein